jgi:phosphotransferase system HPr (HPr) family protein
MPDVTLTILDPSGLHARPAARLVQVANRFASRVHLRQGDREANAKSLVSLLELTVQPASEITLVADGPDAESAIAALTLELAPFLATSPEPIG